MILGGIPDGFDWKNPDYDAVYQLRLERLRRLLAEIKERPEALAEIKAFYRDNPVAFINDWGMTYDPRNLEIGRPAEIPFLLFPKQAEFIGWTLERWRAREGGIVEKSRDMGVSWLCVGIAVWMWLYYPGASIGFGSRKEEYVDQAGDMKALFPKIRMFIARLPVELRPEGYKEKVHAVYMRILNPENGAQIVGEAGDNIGRGGRTSIYFVDEAAHLERPLLVDAALSQNTNCRLDVSTPNGETNPFASKRHGGNLPVFTLHWRQHPAKDEVWYRRECKLKFDNNPVLIAQELDISYTASSTDTWISGELVEPALTADSSLIHIPVAEPLKMAVDVARFGGAESVVTLRRGRVVFWQKIFRKLSTVQLSAEIYSIIDAMPVPPDQVAVDVIGVGAGVVDQLRVLLAKKRIPVVAVNSSVKLDDGKNYNVRSFMWRAMKEWFTDGPVSIPNDRLLKTQISTPKYKFKGELLLIESKDDMLKRQVVSPDRADSLALTFAQPAAVIQREEDERRRTRNWRTA